MNETNESGNIQITIDEKTKVLMEELKQMTGNNNRSNIIRQSLKIFHYIVKNIKEGNNIVIEKDGVKEVIHIII